MLHVSVKNGTRAGTRTVQAAPRDWVCGGCGASLKKHWRKCPSCSEPRPDLK